LKSNKQKRTYAFSNTCQLLVKKFSYTKRVPFNFDYQDVTISRGFFIAVLYVTMFRFFGDKSIRFILYEQIFLEK